jgi:spore coat protein CotF
MFSQFFDLAKGLNVRKNDVFHSHHRPNVKQMRNTRLRTDMKTPSRSMRGMDTNSLLLTDFIMANKRNSFDPKDGRY